MSVLLCFAGCVRFLEMYFFSAIENNRFFVVFFMRFDCQTLFFFSQMNMIAMEQKNTKITH